ncbi:Ltp family lipoprotein [Rothia uropygialis]
MQVGAEKRGEGYSKAMHMAKQGIYDQLYGEKLTPEEGSLTPR